MQGRNHTDTIVSCSGGTRDGVIVRGEQHSIRVVFVGTRNFDKNVGSFEVRPRTGAGRIHNSRVEVINNFDVGVDRLDS